MKAFLSRAESAALLARFPVGGCRSSPMCARSPVHFQPDGAAFMDSPRPPDSDRPGRLPALHDVMSPIRALPDIDLLFDELPPDAGSWGQSFYRRSPTSHPLLVQQLDDDPVPCGLDRISPIGRRRDIAQPSLLITLIRLYVCVLCGEEENHRFTTAGWINTGGRFDPF